MMKDCTKRKRTRDEMEEVREFEQSLKEDRHKFLQKTKRLKEERDELQQQVDSLSQSQQTVQQLYDRGLVDENGDPINPPYQRGDMPGLFT